MPDKFSRFWHELKRRKVVQVTTVYAGAAFVIIELINNITEPLRLPEWTPTLVIILLLVGLPLAVILSWIFDIGPEGGLQKTDSTDKVQAGDIPKSSNGWKVASYISFVVIVGLILLNVIPRSGKKEILDKSIAVLPFINDSPASENEHVLNAYMTAVHNNLCKIKDLRVLSLQTTEQYRNQTKSIPEIARELGVGYLLSARGQIINNRIQLTVNLADNSDDIIWSNPYDRQIERVEDHIDIQSDIAQLVAGEIQAVITPEEKELIGKIPTTSLTALDLYQRGWEIYHDYLFKDDREALERAEDYYHRALGIDSTFAQAYVGLAEIYWDKHNMSDYFGLNYLDSILILANRALSFDEQSSEAYVLRGGYYREIGNNEAANTDFKKAIRFNPNNGRAYNGLGLLYLYSDIVKSLENFHRAMSIDRGPHLAVYLANLQMEYFSAGFIEKTYYYLEEYLKLSGDSTMYFRARGQIANFMGDYRESISYSKKAIELGGSGARAVLAESLLRSGSPEEALSVYERWMEDMNASGGFDFRYAHRIAYAYWINGLNEKAEFYFNKQIEYCQGLIDANRPWAQLHYTYYDLAGVYAFRGEKELAFESLRIFNQVEEVPYWLVQIIKQDELFNSIRGEPEFQQIVRDLEAKYKAVHERVRTWLEENDLL